MLHTRIIDIKVEKINLLMQKILLDHLNMGLQLFLLGL